MLQELIKALIEAKNMEEKEKAYRALEQVGMDRATALFISKVIKKGEKYADK